VIAGQNQRGSREEVGLLRAWCDEAGTMTRGATQAGQERESGSWHGPRVGSYDAALEAGSCKLRCL
jgi:hypothetical protein